MLEAFEVLGVRKIVLGAPWSADVNLTVAKFLMENGIEVMEQRALGHVANVEVGRLPASTAFRMGVDINRNDADAVFLACGNWRTMSVIDDLERAISKPVLTTNQVSLWAVLRILNDIKSLDGYGSLLRNHLRTAS
jgi:maleate isomerase